jgi:hypothetical protein
MRSDLLCHQSQGTTYCVCLRQRFLCSTEDGVFFKGTSSRSANRELSPSSTITFAFGRYIRHRSDLQLTIHVSSYNRNRLVWTFRCWSLYYKFWKWYSIAHKRAIFMLHQSERHHHDLRISILASSPCDLCCHPKSGYSCPLRCYRFPTLYDLCVEGGTSSRAVPISPLEVRQAKRL